MKLQNMFKKIRKTGNSTRENRPEVPQGLLKNVTNVRPLFSQKM